MRLVLAHLLDIILKRSNPQGVADAVPDSVKDGKGPAVRHAPGVAHSCYGGSRNTPRSLDTARDIFIYKNGGDEDENS